MNRVYKIVWSKAKNAYVVTSELAKNHTKNASGKMVKTALTAAVGMGVLMGGYMADAAPATNPSGDGPGIAIGTGSSSQKVDSTAVGKNAKTTGERALAVGYNSIADADSAMAVGNGNKAMAGGSLAVGARNIAQGMGGLAIGESNTAKGDDSAAVGHSNKVHAMGTYAFGLQNTVWKMYSQAYGMNNIVSEINSFAYGNSNQVGSMNSFAFGGANLNTARWAVTVGNTNKVGGEHSFAAGFYNTIGSTSKDAVAIGQNARVGVSDFNVATTIDPTTGEIKAVYNGEVDATNSVAIGNEANVMALNSVALGENTGVTKDGKNGTAIGGEASVKAENGTAAGFKATVRAKSGVALGASSFVDAEGGIALGRNSVAERKSGRAGYDFTTGAVSTINDSTWKATDGAVSVGNSANTRQITRVAAGTEDTDAVNVAQIKGLAKQFTADGVSYFHVNATNTAVAPVTNNKGTVSAVAGAGGKNSTAAGIAAKVQKDAEESTAIGYSTNVTKKNGTVVGNRSSVSGEGGSAFGYNSQANDVNATAIGAASRATKEGAFAGGYSAQATGIRSVAVGSGAKADSTSTVAIGDGANVASNVDLVGGIAIGKKAYVLNGGGRQEAELGLDRSNWPASISGAYNNPINKDRVATGIAIGTNAYARTGSVQIGAHTYTGTMGGTSINANTNGEGTVVNMTTIGSNSYNKAVFGTMVGAYSIASGDFNGSGGFNRMYTGQNFGASVVGSLNSIRTKGYGQYSGIANSIVGLANTTENSNGSLIFGAGNNITNSIKNISGVASGANTPDEMSAKLRKAIQDNESGGAVMALGGGNTADWAQASQIVGVNNTLKGTRGNISKYNLIDGYKNTADRVSNVSVIGSENNVTNTNGAVVFGDKRTLTGADGSVVIGSSQNGTSTSVKNAVAIGSEANVTVAGGVALGSGSVASVDKGTVGYDASGTNHNSDTTGVWKSTASAVSVGDAAGNTKVTRQITNVAAGKEDTDAVNVAQLKAVKAAADAAKVHFFSVKGNSSDENYNNDGATGDRALAVGVAAKAGGLKATALTGGNASGDFSFAVGNNAQAKGWGSVAIGAGTLAENQGTVAIGHGAKAYSLESVALGYNTQAGAPSGQPGAGNHAQTAMGSGTIATGGAATAFGFESVASGAHAIAGGDKAKATGQDSVALGKDTEASGTWSVALGSDTKAEGQSSTALGTDTTASGIASTAMGSKTQATGVGSTAMGGSTTAAGNWSLASGGLSEAKGDYSTAMGYNSKANARNSFAVSGGIVETAAENSIAMGEGAKASVSDAVALRSGSVASTEKGKIGYDISGADHSNDTTGVWKSTANAVSVGDASKGITRQITGVAAGAADTDAVNVAQLKKVEAKAEAAEKKHTTVKAGDYATVTEGTNADGGKEYTVSGPKMESTDGTVKITDKVENGKKVGYNLSVDTSSLGIEKTKVEAGDNVTVTSKKTGNTTTYTVNAKDTVVTGGTATYAANGTGSATLINNDGTTATITGLKDRYTSSAALDGNTLNFTRNDGSTYSVSGIASTQDIKNVTNKVGELGTRVNRAGAGAAALAALHPLDFDPDDKWDVAAGYGNYKDAHAVSVGAFYRPNEDTMFSVGGSFGGGENMVNAGVSVKLGQGNHVSTSKVAMAKEIVDLKDAVTRLEAQNEQFRQIIGQMAGQPVRNVEFPDVPKDHWAYSYVKSLADRGLLEGYPDGEFKGDRTMTRYEFAAIIYRALQNGAPVDGNMGKAMEEFGPEMEKVREAYRFRVDRISGEDNDRNKVERVRVNNEGNKEKGDYRDIYGSHIAAGK